MIMYAALVSGAYKKLLFVAELASFLSSHTLTNLQVRLWGIHLLPSLPTPSFPSMK